MNENRALVREEFQDMFFEDKSVLGTRSTQYLKKWLATCTKAVRKNSGADKTATHSRKMQTGKGPKKKIVEAPVSKHNGKVKPYSKVHTDWVNMSKGELVKHGNEQLER